MSTVSSATSSAVSYATQLAQSSALKRSLTNIGNAIQNGDMTTANSLLTTFIQQNPQYAASSSSSSQSSDPISQDFQTLAAAVSNNQTDAAQSAWSKVKSDLNNDGVSLSTSANSTAQIIAQNKASTDQTILSDLFGNSSSDGSLIGTLLGGSSDSGSTTGLSSSLLESWVTYQQGGSATPATPSSLSSNILNTLA
ncbi:MAG TPA: hypothetical protein VH413_16565 [Verrucomicrobiae bacterium]|nr:hypothetical protein [Verrucomicrobiae bacterium]